MDQGAAMPRVYIETTVPSFYFDTRADPTIVAWRRSTRRWWDRYRHRYDLVTSEAVIAELDAAPLEKARSAKALLRGLPLLPQPAGFDDLVSYYIDHKLVPRNAQGDAAHLALASLHGIDYLLTWNCRHLANTNKARHLAVLNGRLNLPIPTLATPDILLP
jgi:hypothetical protein